VRRNPDPSTHSYSPWLIVLQSHHLEPLETIFLAPLVTDAARALTPVDIPVEFLGREVVIAVGEAAGIPKSGYTRVVGSLADAEDSIRRAFERLLGGF
jgi:hypothetical protein